MYDRSDFFGAYSRLRRSTQGLDDAPEWLAIRAFLPDLADKRVVDLGCGFGRFARLAKQHGAARVLGLDLSENMISRAAANAQNPTIEYAIADLNELELPEECFDFGYSSLAFHYIEDFAKLVDGPATAARHGRSTATQSKDRARQTGLHRACSSRIAPSPRR